MADTAEGLITTIELSLKKLVELHNFKVNVAEYIDNLKQKAKGQNDNDEKNDADDEKKENNTKISLLTDETDEKMCPKGHSLKLKPKKEAKKCNQCDRMAQSICGSCHNFDRRYKQNIFDKTKQKYYCCTECSIKNAKNVKQMKKNIEKKQQEMMRYNQENPEVVLDLLCGLPSKLALESLLEEVVVTSVQERDDFCLYMLDVDNFKQLNKDEGHHGADEKLREIAAILKTFQSKPSSYWKDEGVEIERIWCFRQGGDEFSIVVKGKEKKIKTQKKFYELLKGDINKLKISISVGMLAYGRDYETMDKWLELADDALYVAKDVKGKNAVRIFDGCFAKRKVVEGFENIFKG
eukprot:119546_1